MVLFKMMNANNVGWLCASGYLKNQSITRPLSVMIVLRFKYNFISPSSTTLFDPVGMLNVKWQMTPYGRSHDGRWTG
jgi:hypothetical protein